MDIWSVQRTGCTVRAISRGRGRLAPRKASMQTSAKRCSTPQRARLECRAERALRLAGIAFPPFDDHPVLGAERVRRPTAHHRRLGLRHLVVELGDRCRGWAGVSRERRAVPGELAVLERHRLLCLVEHRGELEVGGKLAVDSVHRLRELAHLVRIGRERSREPADQRRKGSDDRGDEIGHAPIVPRRPCIHRANAIDTSDVCCGQMLRPRDRTLATPYFPVGGPVPAADLVGRETYLRRLTERLEDGQHVLISGPRRIGKTSIIIEALRRLRRHGAYTAYVDCLGATDIRGLGERLPDAVQQNLSGVERSLERAKPLDLTDAGGHRFGIDPDDWLEYLKTKFAAKKLAIDDASVDRLLDATGGHPQDTMQVCAALYYLMRDAGSRSVTPDLLEVAYEQAMRELERPFALHWTELGSHKYLQQVAKRIAHRAVLYAAEADGGAVPRPEVLRALAALQERGLAVRLGRGRYDFVEPMFGEYVRRLDEGLMAGTVPAR